MSDDIRSEQRRRLRILEEQRAHFGGYSPPHIIAEIEDLQRALGIFSRSIGGFRCQSSPSSALVPATRRC
jgi:hypothetical protein